MTTARSKHKQQQTQNTNHMSRVLKSNPSTLARETQKVNALIPYASNTGLFSASSVKTVLSTSRKEPSYKEMQADVTSGPALGLFLCLQLIAFENWTILLISALLLA